MITKPLLAVNAENTAKLNYPVWATPKLDGIRSLVVGGKLLSRTFKQIPNEHVSTRIEQDLGHLVLDGELMLSGKEPFNEVSSAIMSEEGEPDFRYYVFDAIPPSGLDTPYLQRMEYLASLELPSYCVKLLPIPVRDQEELRRWEASYLEDGYEGVMIRSPHSKYKCGRSTLKEGILLKVKQFEDAEAVIVGFDELLSNQNEATKDAFGRTERSSHKENMVPTGTLGSLQVVDVKTGISFSIGTGFNATQREQIWKDRDKLIGKTVKYKKQPSGEHEKPRFPVFLGFRHKDDM